MNPPVEPNALPSPVDADEISRYLRSNPDFFNQHPEVLGELSLSHAPAGTSSLLEHQIRLLREQSIQQRTRLDQLIAIAQQNEELHQRVQQLILDLLLCRSDAELFEQLQAGMEQTFRVEQLGCCRLSPQQLAAEPLLHKLLQEGQPRCGRFSAEQLQPLFGEQASRVASAVLIPLSDDGVKGVLGMASGDEQRYHPGVATDYLARLGAFIARLMRRNDRDRESAPDA